MPLTIYQFVDENCTSIIVQVLNSRNIENEIHSFIISSILPIRNPPPEIQRRTGIEEEDELFEVKGT